MSTIDYTKLSPMMQHYFEVKKQYPDTILMYRLGDFYEMFFDDALEASKLLDITLTGRDCGLDERAPMCGVPYHAVDAYIGKLIKCGKKVSICEQLTAPGDQKGMVKRDVIRVITPGTVTSDSVLDGKTNNYLLAAYAKGKQGAIAWLDISTGELNVIEIEDIDNVQKLEDLLLSIEPSEIIASSEAYATISALEAVNVGKLPRAQSYYNYAFDFDNAQKTLLDFYAIHNLSALGIEANPLAVSVLGAILFYAENTQKTSLKHILTPKLIRKTSRMFLDYNTKRNLELTETLNDRSKTGSLLWVLDNTKTNMGARMLRAWIQEPLRNADQINMRLDAVQELSIKSSARAELGALLGGIRDIERLCNKLSYNSINPRECLAVAYSLKRIPPLKKTLSVCTSSLIKSVDATLNSLDEVANLIDTAINEDAPTAIKDGGIIKNGYNEELDKYRYARSSAKKWLAEYEAKEREATGIKTLKLGYNKVFGYYLEISKSFVKQAPYSYQRKQTLTTGERFITPELKEMEETILGAEEKAQKLEETLYADVKAVLVSAIKILQSNARAVAVLDCLYSFAEVACKNNYVRPQISDKISTISIKNGRHPVVEAIKKSNEFVPNDTLIDQSANTLIVTGPNMAGKSTYMRQVALIVLMAHIGCFVPADEAKISLVDRVFTRVGASDNLAFGQSTFMVEMSEVANILNNATKDSLLVLDEIGRGTSTLDGLSIAWAIVEHIALKLKAKTLFATHYHELSELENVIPNLKNYHVLIKENGDSITFLYKIARGGANKSFGIEVAHLAGVNQSVIDRAKDIMSALENNHALSGGFNVAVTANASAEAVPTQQISFFDDTPTAEKEVVSVLRDLDLDSTTPIQALTILADLKKSISDTDKKKRKKCQ